MIGSLRSILLSEGVENEKNKCQSYYGLGDISLGGSKVMLIDQVKYKDVKV